METIPRGFKFRTILDRFGWDLLLILREALVENVLDLEHIKLQILMTLSDVSKNNEAASGSNTHSQQKLRRKSYVNELLFRDYSATKDSIWHSFDLPATGEYPAQTIHIHDEAITYLASVLERRLTLAQNLKEKPTNLHLLFILFSHYSTHHSDWRFAKAYRHLDSKAANQDRTYFGDCAQKLADLRSSLGSSFSVISHRRREQYGLLWLEVGDCGTELPEELSLFDVFYALPLALNAEFFNDSSIQKQLVRVLDSLNERYKLLRSAGLSPQIWLERTEPSIAVLRDLKQLRTNADEYMRVGEATLVTSAFRLAFNATLADEQRKKLAGCVNFEEFAQTEYGLTMLKYSEQSLDQTRSTDSEEDLNLYEAISGTDFEEEMVQSIFIRLGDSFDWVQYLIDSRPELFDEITTLFFQQIIGMDSVLDGAATDQPLLKNQKFKELIKQDARYNHLDVGELSEQLIEEANKIIEQGIRLCSEESESSMVTGGD